MALTGVGRLVMSAHDSNIHHAEALQLTDPYGTCLHVKGRLCTAAADGARTLLAFSACRCASEDMRGVSGPGLLFCCCAKVEWIVANLR